MIVCVFLALINGILIGASRAINGRLSVDVGVVRASFWNHLVGFIFLTLIIILIQGVGQLTKLTVPPFAYLGGAIGALFVLINSYVFKKLGAIKTALLVISGQMITGVLIDYKSGHALYTLGQCLGIVLILLGVYLSKNASLKLPQTKIRVNNLNSANFNTSLEK